jgi:hypothetical protein
VKVKTLTLILVLVLVGAVSAVAADWYKLAEIVGVVKPQSSTLVPIRIDLGTLQPAQSFFRDANTTLTCNGEYDVSKLIIAVPSLASEWYAMAGGFKNLYLKVTIDVMTLTLPDIPVVENGSSAINPGADSAYWKFEFQEGALAYYSYKGKLEVFNPLEPGDHIVFISVYGETSAPAQEVNLSLTLYLEIKPALKITIVPVPVTPSKP